MKIFRAIGSFLSGIFKSPAAKKILSLATDILFEVVGAGADQLARIAQEEVRKAEAEGGPDKHERVLKAIRGRVWGFKDLSENAIDIAIVTAVAAMKREIAERNL